MTQKVLGLISIVVLAYGFMWNIRNFTCTWILHSVLIYIYSTNALTWIASAVIVSRINKYV